MDGRTEAITISPSFFFLKKSEGIITQVQCSNTAPFKF